MASRDDGPPRYASIRLGDVRIGLCEAEPVDPSRRAHPVMTEIVIEVGDVRQVHRDLQERGVVITEGLEERPWGLVDFRVTDPDGYYLRFTSHRSEA